MIEEAANAAALRKDNWKYIEFHASKYKPTPGTPELYDLSEDIAEANNVIKDHPEIADSLKEQLHALQKSTGIRN
jgi:arylsulfatase A-like enzyme